MIFKHTLRILPFPAMISLLVLPFFSFCAKSMVKVYYDQHLVCPAPKLWLKYITHDIDNEVIFFSDPSNPVCHTREIA